MEQFKQLNWSWRKYEEEKNYLPRNFSFETISDNDALSRNLNEIHTCVISDKKEYRIFKTNEEIAANHFELDISGNCLELKDPRRCVYRKLEDSKDLIKEYSNYSSELKKHEQLRILNSLKSDIQYNPKYSHRKFSLQQKDPLDTNILNKWHKEVEHFERCAEIYYHRHITQFNSILCEEFKEILIEKWKKLEAQFPYANYQAITMILRNSNSKSESLLTCTLHEELPVNFNPDFYIIPENIFLNIQNASVESLKLYLNCKEVSLRDSELTPKADIQISLDILTKLFVDDSEFNAIFINDKTCTRFIFNETVPLKAITELNAIEEAIKLVINFNIEWNNASKCVHEQQNHNIDYKLCSINETMSKIFKNYKKHAGSNNEINLWTFEAGSQKLLISVSNNNCYFMNDQTKIIISIKFEYQTTFGAEQMTKEELLKEWIQIKFSKNTFILRLRIDTKSMEILSVIKLNIEDVERELMEIYSYSPQEPLEILFNVFNCIHNLPESRYIIQAQRNEKDCNKFMVYKEVAENGKSIINFKEDFQMSETFTRKWIPIDKNIPTFIHLNEEMAPCCFSYKFSRKISYIMPTKSQKVQAKKVVEKKSPHKTQILRKRTRKKNNRKKSQRLLKNLNDSKTNK